MYVIILCIVAGQTSSLPHSPARAARAVTPADAGRYVAQRDQTSQRTHVRRPPVAATNRPSEELEIDETMAAPSNLDGPGQGTRRSELADLERTPPTDENEAAKQETPDWLTPNAEQPATAPMDLNGLAFKMFFATVAVMAAAIASIFLGRQWLEQRRPAEPLGRQVRVLETKSLSPRASLQLVDAAGQMVLVGVDAQGIKGMVRLTGAFEEAWQDANEAVPEEA